MADAAPKEQTVAVEHLEQPVTSHIDTVVTLKHDLEFARPYARMAVAYVMHQAQNHVFLQLALTGLIQMVMVGLPCIAKQTAQAINAFMRMALAEATHCLAPDFFLIDMPSSFSAMSIMMFRASDRKRSRSSSLRRRLFSCSRDSSLMLS